MNHNKKNIISALVFSMLSIIAYLITYNNKVLFFLVFVCERLYSFGAKEELEKSLDDLELEDGKKARNTLGVIIALILGTIGISIYSIFKYPQILIILILVTLIPYFSLIKFIVSFLFVKTDFSNIIYTSYNFTFY